MRVSKRKVEIFLSLRFQKQKNLYKKKLDIAVEVIQDFLNCEPTDVGELQGSTFNTIYNIDKEKNLY